MASKASILNPPNETENSFTRTTKEGKKLTYTLKVIQQPERARACGAGAKASADRRPVDPPPVVELRVHESDQNGLNKTDITFAYNANFFLFTTLEWARPIAHGRVQGQSSATPPVLTGVPVAGVAYLDRPVQAGYFIFPDLSVRHEGYYRLNFSLYEEVKDPKDEDKDRGIRRPAFPATKPCDPREPEEYIFFRLDVKTTPFTVYSAKKFPGLAESTMLSRTVAEQGCRVRIRRDVRMRRREAKGNKDFRGGYDDRHMTPDSYPNTPDERPRSASNASAEVPYPYCPTPPRAPSAQGFSYSPAPYQQPVAIAPPPGPSPTPLAPSHLAFGTCQVPYNAPPVNVQQQPPPPPPPQPQQQQPQPTSQPPAAPIYPSPRPNYTHGRQISCDTQPQKYVPSPVLKPDPLPMESSRTSLPPILTKLSPNQKRVLDSTTNDRKHPLTHMPPPSNLPSKPQLPMPTPFHIVPEVPIKRKLASNPLPPIFDSDRGKGWIFSEPPPSGKRSHGDSFGSAHLSRPLYDGARPDIPSDPDLRDPRDHTGGDDDSNSPSAPFIYYRADGRMVRKTTSMNA